MNTQNNIRLAKHAISDLQLGFPVIFNDRMVTLLETSNITKLQKNQYILISSATSRMLGLDEEEVRLHKMSDISLDFFIKGAEQKKIKDYSLADELDKEIIKLAKLTGRLPVMVVSSLSPSPCGRVEECETFFGEGLDILTKNTPPPKNLSDKSLNFLTPPQGGSDCSFTRINSQDISDYIKYSNQGFKKVIETKVPLKRADAKVMLFRSPSGMEHIAIQAGELSNNPLVRIHSACITGDLFESLKCDCGQQLHKSIELISEGGVVLYMNQEGRGIQLENKLRAYNLQAKGLDTVEANEQLGFEPDERDFSPAADILKQMGINKIRLLTNNPVKAKLLNIEITEIIPLIISPNEENACYLETKKKKMGHQML